MIVQRTFAVLGNKEQVKATYQVPKRVSARHGATNRRCFASTNSDTATQLLTYEIDNCRNIDSLHADPESQSVRRTAPTHNQNCLGAGSGGSERCQDVRPRF
jgi:hypothetical protein